MCVYWPPTREKAQPSNPPHNPNQHHPSHEQVFYLATQGGAEVLGLGAQVGNFEPGKYFDALIVDPNTDDSPLDIFDGEVSSER